MAAKQVTLTFDNGPTPHVTDRILEILDRAGIKTTFFVIGQRLDDPAAADLMRAAHTAGHWIGNHTFTHSGALGDRTDRIDVSGLNGRLIGAHPQAARQNWPVSSIDGID
jgi:peptidoglycan/xylan/chitin deacetylase (PgdA/CDA1 family)